MQLTPASMRRSRLHRRSGFTLLEIIIAIAILGLLVGLAVSNLTGAYDKAQVNVADTFVRSSMNMPLTSYRLDMGDYPSTADGLQALARPPQSRADRWRGPYVKDGLIPEDPFGEPYQYRYPGVKNKQGYDLWSKGVDKIDGTADDIGNWPRQQAETK